MTAHLLGASQTTIRASFRLGKLEARTLLLKWKRHSALDENILHLSNQNRSKFSAISSDLGMLYAESFLDRWA